MGSTRKGKGILQNVSLLKACVQKAKEGAQVEGGSIPLSGPLENMGESQQPHLPALQGEKSRH